MSPSQDEDREFAFGLFKEAKATEFVQSGLPDEQLDALLRQQFDMRESQWRARYPKFSSFVVLDGESAIGEWCMAAIERWPLQRGWSVRMFIVLLL